MDETSAERVVADLLPRLRSPQITYFPIRHHSPACARLIREWIESNRPAAVLVEGPSSFDRFIDALVDPECRCPVAVYSHFIDRRGLTSKAAPNESSEGMSAKPARFAAFYPFCDYSPELVALRAGRAVGARLRFIDLEFSSKVLEEFSGFEAEQPSSLRVESLADDPHLRRSRYMDELARRFGCRDFDELWDHLFESGLSADCDAFVDRLATYCAIARLDYDPDTLERDGTRAREAWMAARIRKETGPARKQGRPVLVVTGGLHTAALPYLVEDKKTKAPTQQPMPEDEVGDWLIPYSFEQLDSLTGYASGMPNPAFYDRVFASESDEAYRREVASILLDFARRARDRGQMAPISTPDVIAAQRCSEGLASLRGRPWPLRQDVIDAACSCFVKGDIATDGYAVMQTLREVLAGDRIGRVPPRTELPAIVDDFRREATRLKIATDSIEPRAISLDLYRKPRHRERSRFFHRLDVIGAPLASFEAGPDFVNGTGLDRMHEHWRLRWSPGVEASLVEASVYGATIESAAAAKLDETITQSQEAGTGRSASAAVALLVRACRMGLHSQADRLLGSLGSLVEEDPSFPSVVSALAQIDLLHQAREPLEAASLDALPALATACFHRATNLMAPLSVCPDAEVNPVIEAMRALRESVVASSQSRGDAFDTELMLHGLRRIAASREEKAQPPVVGAAAGLLYVEGDLGGVQLVELVQGYLASAMTDARRRCGVVRGVLATAREAAWQDSALLQAVDEQLARWEEDDFLSALPELRLTFADLSPSEISRVAEQVAKLRDGGDLGDLVFSDIEEGEAIFAARVTQVVRDQLASERPHPSAE